MSWKTIWKNLALEIREEAAEAMFEQFEEINEPDAIAAAHQAIAEGCRIPVKRFRNQSRTQRAKLLAKARPLAPEFIVSSLRFLHLRRRTELLTAFLGALGVEHEQGMLSETPDEPASVEDLVPAMRVALRNHARADCELYWSVLETMGDAYWSNLPEAHAALLAGEVAVLAEPPKERPARAEPGMAAPVFFTHLDGAVIDAIVASVAGTAGALNPEQIRGMVNELLALNVKRVISYHHLGFLDAMESGDKTVEVSFPEANEERRGWYLAGAVAAYARRAQHDRILELLDRYRHDFEQFGRGVHTAHDKVLPQLFEALCAKGRSGEAANLFHPLVVGWEWEELAEPILHEVVGFLRYQRVDEAEPLIDLLLLAGAAEPKKLERAGESGFVERVMRRQAHCLRLRRKWSEADELLSQIADKDDGMLLTDRGMIACRIRSLVDVALPSDPDARLSFAESLEPGQEFFEAATRTANRRGHGDYCMGVLHLARGDADGARPHLRRAVADMGRKSSIYRELGILGRAELYLAYAESQAMDVAQAPAAFSALAASLEERRQEVPDLVRGTLESLALIAPRRTREFLTDWREVLGDDFLDIACESQFLRDEPELRELVQQRAQRTTRSPAQRFSDHEALLAAAIATGDEDAAADELDSLEALAEDLPARFLALLDNEEKRGTLWDVEDVALAKARVLRGQGRLPEAAGCLRAVAYLLLRDDEQDGARQAHELLELIESIGVEPEEQLAAAVRGAMATEASEPVVAEEEPVSGKILFVGGHEAQARYDDVVRARIQERYPAVELVMKHPGWESTWARQLKRMDSDVKSCDAMVIMRFVRTQLGRTLRKRCNERPIRWYACTGHGLDSICRAIEVAALGLRVGA